MGSGPTKVRNMAELAQISGVSRPTLSKYFDDPASVKEVTRLRIEAALEMVDYRPNFHATSLNRRRPRTIGILVPTIADPFYAEIVRQIEVRCVEAGYWPLVLSSHGQPALEERAVEMLLSLNAGGAIVAPLGTPQGNVLYARLSREMHLVFFDSELENEHVFVGTDNSKSVAMIVDYLCRTGSAPVFLEMPSVNRNAQARRTAYIAAMEELEFEPRFIPSPEQDWAFETAGFRALSTAIDQTDLSGSTILCANDRLAFGAMSAACKAGLKIGRGSGAIRIAGHDDHPLSRYSCPALTTVRQDTEGMAELTTRLLFQSIAQGSKAAGAKRQLLGSTLMMRETA